MGHYEKFVVATAVAIASLLSQSAQAVVTYTYTGNPFVVVEAGTPHPNVDRIEFSVNLADYLPANRDLSSGFGVAVSSWSISDGFQSFWFTDPGVSTNFFFATDSGSNITEWYITVDGLEGSDWLSLRSAHVLTSTPDGLLSPQIYDDSQRCSPISCTHSGLGDYFVRVLDSPGSWTSIGTSIGIPEPSTLVLLSIGLVGAGFSRRRGLF